MNCRLTSLSHCHLPPENVVRAMKQVSRLFCFHGLSVVTDIFCPGVRHQILIFYRAGRLETTIIVPVSQLPSLCSALL